MKSRIRHISHRRLLALSLHMDAMKAGKKGVLLSNSCLRQILELTSIRKEHIEKLAPDFAPFLVNCEAQSFGHTPKRASFLLPGIKPPVSWSDLLHVMWLRSSEDIERDLRFDIKRIETRGL
jgi:hypothetical protein